MLIGDCAIQSIDIARRAFRSEGAEKIDIGELLGQGRDKGIIAHIAYPVFGIGQYVALRLIAMLPGLPIYAVADDVRRHSKIALECLCHPPAGNRHLFGIAQNVDDTPVGIVLIFCGVVIGGPIDPMEVRDNRLVLWRRNVQ